MSAKNLYGDSGSHCSEGGSSDSERSKKTVWHPWSKALDCHKRILLLEEHRLERIFSQQPTYSDARDSYLSPNLTEFISDNHMADNMCFRQSSNMRSSAPHLLVYSSGEVYKLLTNIKSKGLYEMIKTAISGLDCKEFDYSRVSKVRPYLNEADSQNEANSTIHGRLFADHGRSGLESISDRELFDMCTKAKSMSCEIQEFIKNCQEGLIPLIAQRVINLIPYLLKHPLGNYVLQRLLIRSDDIRTATSRICLRNLKEHAMDEFSSRVMQTLAESDEFFRTEIIKCATTHFIEFSNSISATLLVCACIRVTGASRNFAKLVDAVLYQFAQPIDPNSYLLRHVVAVARVCSLNSLVKIFNILKTQCQNDSIFRCKKRLMVLVALLNRNFEPANLYLNGLLRQVGTWNAINTKYFTYLAKKLDRVDEALYEGSSLARIFRHILSSQTVMRILIHDLGSPRKPSHQSLYICYLLGIVGPSDFHTVLLKSRGLQVDTSFNQRNEFKAL
jgi:hypothetical protein